MKTYKIGQKIKHGPVYPMTCHERFLDIEPDERNQLKKRTRNRNPCPLYMQGESFVIGFKRAIMANYTYEPEHISQGFEDPWPEVERAYANGTYEECLVCVKNMKPFKPYFVRKQDVYD